MKRAIVCANYGGYDAPIPIKKYEGWDRYYFTDQKIKIDGWIVEQVQLHKEPAISSRIVKILTHQLLPKYDQYLWIDANMELVQVPNNTFRVLHPTRRCITHEAIRIDNLSKGDVYKQVVRYIAEGMPVNYGLFSNGYFCRDRTEDKIHEQWFKEYNQRDQIALPYVYWKNNKKIEGVPWHKAMTEIKIYDPLHNSRKR